MISLPSPILCPMSGHLIQLQHHRLIIEPDLELTQEVMQVYYTNEDGQFGIPLLESIGLNPSLTDEQKSRQRQVFKPIVRSVSTRGDMIDPVTTEIVLPNESGQYPEGAIPERVMWLSVLASEVPGDTLSSKVIALIVTSMQKMAERNKI